ncbi:MAG: site-2 protease family protein, partial [Gammaproteobacteria bacterium]
MAQVGLSVIAFIVAIGVLVSVHEFGHFWVARRLGFVVLRFSVGFGRPLIRWRGGQLGMGARLLNYLKSPKLRTPEISRPDSQATEYWVSAIPLGGYVKLLDEREGPVPEEQRHLAFNRRPISHRIAVLLAGPGFNFLFAILIYWVMFVSGVPGIKPIVGAVVENSVAFHAGLRADDEIVAVGGRTTQTLENFVLAILDELLADGLIPLTVVDRFGETRQAELDVRGRQAELTEPGALFTGLGIDFSPQFPAVIGELTPGAAAERAGFQTGDRVVAVDGRLIRSWTQWVRYVQERPGEAATVTVVRERNELDLELHIGSIEEGGKTIGRIGAGVDRDAEIARQQLQRARTEQRYG